MSEYPETPNCDLMLENKKDCLLLSYFLKYIQNKYVLAKQQGNNLVMQHVRCDELIADFFDIDIEELEKEKQKILEWHTTKFQNENNN